MRHVDLPSGTVHTLPRDLRLALVANNDAMTAWRSITPLARNEWICWTESVKLDATRQHHIERAIDELSEGKRRPCCWPGCPHR
ncbi:MAG: YdeI/OmpD-associated family protein [Candidatus Saccharimonadales bacterium]